MARKQDRVLDALLHADRPMTAGELADRLGVTTRSVRAYISALRAEAAPDAVIVSGPDGYRADRAALARFAARAAPEQAATPHARTAALLRRLVDDADGIDVYDLAAQLHLSESTVEADLTRARARLEGTGLSLQRQGAQVRLQGTEPARRRLIGTLVREEGERAMLELDAIQQRFPTEGLAEFKTALIAHFAEHGVPVNEYGLGNVMLHVAIAVDRVRRDHTLTAAAAPAERLSDERFASVIDGLIAEHVGVRLGAGDVDYLAYLIATRVGSTDAAPESATTTAALLREIVLRAGDQFLVDLDDADFIGRLALHVGNLVTRAQQESFSRNPLTRSIKTGYPMTYELAVYIADEVQRAFGIRVNDDEIAYIAMHVGALFESRRQAERTDVVTASVVTPAYHDVHLALARALAESFSGELVVLDVATRTDVDWASLPGELVISTIEPPVPDDRVVVVAPFPTPADLERVRAAISRLRRQRRRARLAEELTRYFSPELFLRNAHARDPEAMIGLLGERMRDAGVIDDAYIDGAIARERLSSTAFTETLAVPHALAMTASRTAIAIAINDTPMDWGGSRVSVVAFIGFSQNDRAAFQTVFDQFVEVFSEHDAVQRLLRESTDFDAFIQALARLMEA